MQSFPQIVRSRLNSGASALVLLVLIEVLTNFLSHDLTVSRLSPGEALVPLGERRVLYESLVGFILLCLLVTALFWILNSRHLRLAIFLINGLFTVQLFLAALLLVLRLIQSVKLTVTTLILDAIIIFVINILIFALWYWFIETGNTRLLQATTGPAWHFLFPQRQSTYPGYEDWKPHFWDYVFLSYTTSVAFSPTDTLPLSRPAKLLMMTQSAISLIAIVVVAGTAINILAGSA
jgi:hypothetical protein